MFVDRRDGRGGHDAQRRTLLGVAADAYASRQRRDPGDSSRLEGSPFTHPAGYAMSRRDKLARAKGRRVNTIHQFVMYPKIMLEHRAFSGLSPNAHKVLNYLASQCRGRNNGDLDVCEKNARKRGWNISGASLRRGAVELEKAGFIERTRQGGKNKASLYGLSWLDFANDPKCDYHFRRPTFRWRNESGSSRVTQLEPPVAQSPPSARENADTALPKAQSATILLTH